MDFAVFVSIDCGASDVYTDENSIGWRGDNDIIQNGVSRVVLQNNSISHVMDTLRVFTTRKKNCYSINVNNSSRVLVRTSFFYGNYDNKSTPPTFDLLFDGNYWDTVETLIDDYYYYEIIYVVKGKTINVCVAQTKPDQFPFISALEVRSLDWSMYPYVDSSYALNLNTRNAYGSIANVRYRDDLYDRIWESDMAGEGLINVSSNVSSVNVDPYGTDRPPQKVLQNAIACPNTSVSLVLDTSFPPHEVSIHINWHFSEVTRLNSTQKRSFMIFIDDQPFSDVIIPTYANVTEMVASNVTVSANTTFSLVPTNDSTLPPLIHAMEVFYISDPISDGTNSKDVEGLNSLQSKFHVLQGWGGDPCLPAPYNWDWINCSSDATPRVTALYLSSFGLSGPLPDISSMDALEAIDLHNNSLNGHIPIFLGQLPKLKQLVTGNPELCTSGKSCEKRSKKLAVILGTSIPALVLVIVALSQDGGAEVPNDKPHGAVVTMEEKIRGRLEEYEVIKERPSRRMFHTLHLIAAVTAAIDLRTDDCTSLMNCVSEILRAARMVVFRFCFGGVEFVCFCQVCYRL
ncbi:unnamed protein product [Ilex paraguariensis]|uniref:Malectin-like domain-containing protein n=1 Tax=Ilex paraguariensis TaxID=185542 RepID=A0ABC8T459_9AQUA